MLKSTTTYFNRLETVPFFYLFTREERCGGACFALWWKLKRAGHTQDLSKKAHLHTTVNCSFLCSLHFVMLITNAKACQNSLLYPCDMESSQMPLPGSSISATYLFKNKLRALNTLLKRAEYNITRERVFLFPCLKTLHGHTNRWTLCNHYKPSCGVRSSWDGRETPSVSPLHLYPLWLKDPNI